YELGGFTCSFNSGRCCRYCLIYHKDMKHVYRESDILIRTTASHDFHVKHIKNVPNEKSILRNRPSTFKETDIHDKRVPGKVMEKYCLFLNLSFILIDIVDRIPCWFLYELLRQIWDILYSDYPRKSWLVTLEALIQEFLQLSQTIFPEQFIPKCHFLLHAARNTAKYDPSKRQMNLRYESKHHLFKKIANRCNNYINLPCTISKHVQLR
ncbi:unnamed protein product, partial [Adineta steineri]